MKTVWTIIDFIVEKLPIPEWLPMVVSLVALIASFFAIHITSKQ
ncbi:hypothetical protein [Sporomusa ovata]|nr:hypothetical protein [Sporomusa ovata]